MAIIPLGAVLCLGALSDSRFDEGLQKDFGQNQIPTLAYTSPPLLADLKPTSRRLLTGMHEGLYEDWVGFGLMSLVYDKAANPSEASLKRSYLLNFARQLPETESIYAISCYHLAFEEDSGADCREISDAGFKALPRSSSLLMMRGYIEALVLNNNQDALDYFRRAAEIPGSEGVATSMIKSLQAGSFWSDDSFSQTISWLDHSPAGDLLKEYLQQSREEMVSIKEQDDDDAGDTQDDENTEVKPNEE